MDIRISEVIMQSKDNTAPSVRRQVQASTTLNRRYVKRPVRSTDVMVKVNKKPSQPQQQPQVSKLTAKELKERAIKKALAEASTTTTIATQETKSKKSGKIKFGFGRVMLALSCAATAVFAIAYFVNINMPDISLKVAAMQTGINASYPSYVPRNYSTSSITSENGKITLNFTNSVEDTSFSLVEEKSSWDSNALLANYVKPTFKENYSIIKEQGLTLFISGSNAAWVNGGVVYIIKADNNILTNKQIRSIAVSL